VGFLSQQALGIASEGATQDLDMRRLADRRLVMYLGCHVDMRVANDIAELHPLA